MKSLIMFSRQSSSLTSHKTKKASSFKSWSLMNSLTLLITILAILSLSPPSNSQVSAALSPGFCADCQTFANAISPCGVTFSPSDIEINGTYSPPQSAAKCICSDAMQKVLWTCARCELLAGFASKSDPPQKYQTTCISWGMGVAEWNAPYTGVIVPGTQGITGGGTGGTTTGGATGPTTGSKNPTQGPSGSSTGTGTGTASSTGVSPSSTSDNASSGSSGLNGTAVGISLGIIGFAVLGGAVAVFMMKRRRRREPLNLDGTYVGLEDQWEKPPRSQTPPPMPITSRQPAHISPFESRPTGGSVVGGYDGQYDQYDHQYNHAQYGNGGYGYQGYAGHDQGYGGHDQGYGKPDYGFDHNVPPYSGAHGAPKPNEGGQYL